MDYRKALAQGDALTFRGVRYEIGGEIGRGANSIVYGGRYRDALDPGLWHHVLIKELFPLHSEGKIFRREDGTVAVDPEGQGVFDMHRKSFEAGNRAHLSLLEKCPEQIGGNLDSFPLNGTLYSILSISGGENLEKLQSAPARSLRSCAARMLCILDALDAFHANGLAHLDIAPDNILIIGSGVRERAMLIDYNSIMAPGSLLTNEVFEEPDSVVFSVKEGYTAPEVRKGQLAKIGFASDMYSVTAVFYRMLAGVPLTRFQTIRPAPPEVSGTPAVADEPETVQVWVREILRRGLHTLPSKRYRTVEEMRRDLDELIDRIDGIGITHWALWESGKKQADRMIRENPSLSFIKDSASLFPSMVRRGEEVLPADKCIRTSAGSSILLAGGGMGKTTALLRMVFSGNARYSPEEPAVMYLSLYGWQPGSGSYIVDSLLEGLHFKSETRSFAEARKALLELLDRPLTLKRGGTAATLLLLLDGLNEAAGDTKPLLDEILRLSSLRGVRIVTASRTGEDALPFEELHLTELDEDIVEKAAADAGLLIPESEKIRQLLRTPMMLAMFIRSAEMTDRQIRVESAEELIGTYLSALKEKAIRELPEGSGRRWQAEAAMDLVLPAAAAEIHRRKKGLEDKELLPAVERCFRLISGRLSRRFFPQWIGRTAAIRGTAQNAEEWYGQIVHGLLWKHLGLIVRDDQGRYTVAHQALEEYLLKLDRENQKKVFRYHAARGILTSVTAAAVVVCLVLSYLTFWAAKPYDDSMAEQTVEVLLAAYVNAGQQYERLFTLTKNAIDNQDSPDTFGNYLDRYRQGIGLGVPDKEDTWGILEDTLATGDIVSWSRKPLDEDACRELLALSEDRAEDYARYTDVLAFAMSDENARHYVPEFTGLLLDLLETDANITASLWSLAVEPHWAGRYDDDSPRAAGFNGLYRMAVLQNAHESPDSSDAALYLVRLKGQRNRNVDNLNKCGLFYAYEKRG